jgi:hypothetical protein
MATSLSTAETAPPRARLRAYLVRHDPHLMLLRRGLVAAVVTPCVFAFGLEVLDNQMFALFGAFASFTTIGLVWFGGPTRIRALGYLAFIATASVLVVLGTMCSNTVAVAVVVMFVLAFVIRFATIFGGYIAAGANALPLAFVLPAMLPADPGDIVPRLGGWLVGCAIAAIGVLVFVPDRQREALRSRASSLCRDLAAIVVDSQSEVDLGDRLDDVLGRITELRQVWASMPQHPSGPGVGDQAFLSIMEQLSRAAGFVKRDVEQAEDPELDALSFALRRAIAHTLRASADLLLHQPADPALTDLSAVRARTRMEMKSWVDGHAPGEPVSQVGSDGRATTMAETLVGRVERNYPLLVVSHLAVSIGANAFLMEHGEVDVSIADMAPDVPAAAASWRQTFSRGVRLISTHLHVGDLAFQAAMRSGVVLAAAVYFANILPLGHKFWIVLGALSVLRSSAVGTSATGVQAVLGTLIGFVLSGLVLEAAVDHTALLWPAIVIMVFLCVYAPTVISFMVGQASFTLFVVFLFTLMQPSGLVTGVSRVVTVTTGVLIATVGGVLLWPRGARAVVGRQLGAFYRATGRYLDVAGHDFLSMPGAPPTDTAHVAEQTLEARWSADDAFSGLVGEQRTSPEVLEAWVRLLGVPSAVRQIAAVVGSLAPRGYPPCDCDGGVRSVELELDRVEAALERVAARLEHPRDGTAVGWDGDLTGAQRALTECVAQQLARPPAERQSPIGLLWVLEGLHYLDSVLVSIQEPIDVVCANLLTPTFARRPSS